MQLPHFTRKRQRETCLAAKHAEAGHIKCVSGNHNGFIHMWAGTAETMDDARSESCFCTTAVSLTLHGTITGRLYSPTENTMLATDLNRIKSMTKPFSDDIRQTHVQLQAFYYDFIPKLLRFYVSVLAIVRTLSYARGSVHIVYCTRDT